MAPVATALKHRGDAVDTRLALTGQHTDLVDQVFESFNLEPVYELSLSSEVDVPPPGPEGLSHAADYDLELMRPGQSLYDLAHGCLDGLRRVVTDYRPDLLLVQGDTATVFFGALVAFFEGVRVGHVEAGLRSGDKWAPFPEEMLRRLTDGLTDLHFAPTAEARESLLAEGVPAGRIFLTGNTVVDTVKVVGGHDWEKIDPTLERLLEADGRLVLLTAHRRESFGDPIREVFQAVRDVADAVTDVQILYPVHPNPQVREPAEELLAGHPRIHLTGPLAYPDLVRALKEATLVLTDSGGIQEEAPVFGTPVLVLRDVTERPEGLEAGVARLVGTDGERIVETATRLLTDEAERGRMAREVDLYGDGTAGERIADVVVSTLTGAERRTQDWGGPPGAVARAVGVEGVEGEGRG